MVSLAVYGIVSYLLILWLKSWRRQTAAVFGAAILVLLIGFSRLYLGVHYFSDVVAGGMWLGGVISGTETLHRKAKKSAKEARQKVSPRLGRPLPHRGA